VNPFHSDAQIGQQVNQFEDKVGRHRRIRLRFGHDFLQPFPGRFDQSGFVLVAYGLHQLRRGLSQELLVGRWLGLIQLHGQVSQEIGDLIPGTRLYMLRLTEAPSEFLDRV
jgi:hypothetical protein